jgi:hypothetical protein
VSTPPHIKAGEKSDPSTILSGYADPAVHGSCPSPGTRRDVSMRTLRRAGVVPSADEVAEFNGLAARVGVHGYRYNASGMVMVNDQQE